MWGAHQTGCGARIEAESTEPSFGIVVMSEIHLDTGQGQHRPLHRPSMNRYIPYDMFDLERTEAELKNAQKMERIYHKGQERAWDGKELLAELVEKHGGVQLSPEKIAPLRRLFAVIFWGELAAWKVAAELALSLEPLEAKMAASSQAHDEARHFYVLHDYLKLLNYTPNQLPSSTHHILYKILTTNNHAQTY